jgi:hypothetical protein
MSRQRWCHACGKVEDFDDRWFELWIDAEGSCRVKPVTDAGTYHMQFRSDIFACGQLTALVLVERYLHSRTFDPVVFDQAASVSHTAIH